MMKLASQLNRRHHHTLQHDLVRTVLLWSGYFFAVLILTFFLTLSSLIDYMLTEIANDRLSYQTKQFAKHLGEADIKAIIGESDALVKNPTIAAMALVDSSDQLLHVSLGDAEPATLQVEDKASYSSLRMQIARHDHLHLFESAIPGHKEILVLVMDRTPVLYAVYTATFWAFLLLIILLVLSILALHHTLKRHLVAPVHEVKQLMNHQLSDEDHAALLSHLPDEVVELAETFEQAYKARVDMEKRFELMVNVVPCCIWTATPEFQPLYVSPYVRELLGIEPEEFLQKSSVFDELFAGEDYLSISDRLKKTMTRGGKGLAFTSRVGAASDSGKWIGNSIYIEYDDLGHPKSLSGVIYDLTEVKQTESDLRILSLAVEQASDSIMITDRRGVIQHYNAAASRLSGYSSSEARGKTAYFARPASWENKSIKELWECLERGETWRGLLSERRKDGSIYPALTSVSPLRNEAGEITHFICAQQDISDQQALEEKIRQSQKMEALGTLVGGIAHDFNNILAGMTGNLYLAKRKLEDRPDVLEKIKNVEKLNFRAADMINQLLTFARKNTVRMRPFSLAMVIKESLKLARVSIPENITLRHDISGVDLKINGDVAQLQQVLMILLGNSRDAVNEVSEPEIEVTLSEFEADAEFLQTHPDSVTHRFAKLTVEDNGNGISENHLEHIFEPFFTTKGVGKGTGLGLAMVYGVVHSHAGIVQVESIVGRGTVFSIYLPLLEAEQSFLYDNLAPSELPEGHGETILFADDDELVRKTGKSVLESLGYRVLEAVDGKEAMEIFLDNRDTVELLILDVIIPKMGAEEVVARVRELSPEIPVIFATGYDEEQVLNTPKKLPNSFVLTKPFSVQKLGTHINYLLGFDKA